MNKLIITAALSGAGTLKNQTEHLPITPDEIAADVVKVAKAGAAIVHLHARDNEGKNTMDTEIFTEIYEKSKLSCLEAGVDVIFNLTGSGVRFPTDVRLAHLKKLQPEMCSYDPISFNWGDSHLFLNSPEFIREQTQVIKDNDIVPEVEVFDIGMINMALYYLEKYGLSLPGHYQFIMGVPGAMPASPENLLFMKSKIPSGATWSVTGIGRHSRSMLMMGLAMGCDGIRVGLEDNIYIQKGKLGSNEDFVSWAVDLAKVAGREVATAQEARTILGITKNWKDT